MFSSLNGSIVNTSARRMKNKIVLSTTLYQQATTTDQVKTGKP